LLLSLLNLNPFILSATLQHSSYAPPPVVFYKSNRHIIPGYLPGHIPRDSVASAFYTPPVLRVYLHVNTGTIRIKPTTCNPNLFGYIWSPVAMQNGFLIIQADPPPVTAGGG